MEAGCTSRAGTQSTHCIYMKLNHLNLVVPDPASIIHLFETCFGFVCREIRGEHALAILQGADGFTLVLMKSEEAYPKAFHIGFMLNTEEEVAEAHRRLTASGVDAGPGPRVIRGSFGFYFTIDNLMIEVGLQLAPASP